LNHRSDTNELVGNRVRSDLPSCEARHLGSRA
jgi:hypothetical protein